MSKKRIVFIVCTMGLLLLAGLAEANRRTVPYPYLHIQDAINAAVNGDTVLVAEGTYEEHINFNGKAITVASWFLMTGDYEHIEYTEIDGGDSAVVVTFEHAETRDSRLVGFTITGGGECGILCAGGEPPDERVSPTISFCIIELNDTYDEETSSTKGGGIFSTYGGPRVDNCRISDNSADDGGGVYVAYQGIGVVPEFVNCEIVGNVAGDGHGGGLYLKDTEPCMVNCVIAGNSAEIDESKLYAYGGGIYSDDSFWYSPWFCVDNCTFYENCANRGGGLYIKGSDISHPILKNCILWNNSADPGKGPDIYMSSSPSLTLSWCDIIIDSIDADPDQITIIGDTLEADPMFVSLGDYHLSSSSPCIDAGNPDTDHNDPEHPCYPGIAKPMAQGLVHNDIGSYGGPYADDWYDMKLHVDPLALDFGFVPVDEESTLADTVFNLGIYEELELEICSVQSSNPAFVAEALDSLVGAGEMTEIDITFEPTTVGQENGVITFLTSDGSQMVSVSGYGTGPLLVVSPDTLDFGQVIVGTEASDTLYVSNEGTDTLEVTDLICDSLVFQVEDNTPFLVAPSETEPVTVTFAPDAAQPEEATVYVLTDAGEDSVKLLGEGLPLARIEHLKAIVSQNNLYLKWEYIQGATCYRIYRDTIPLFLPSPDDTLATTIEAQYLDTGAVGNPAVNYYYLVFAVNDLTQSPPSIRVGEFDKNMINGAPLGIRKALSTKDH